ncbi:Gfo/Idh/MocA family protein [Metabacillus litoralis]|uniref:Gfo/Idh/MocA family protein n=1 Tax=Metabacillus litoralis TaxID=152268 RepID=UPI00203ECDB1|nr:Gfo/Idh/MocA family oxidoreductase [Metabacillus litoralis]MCM3410858.1 Gfo/Idh/MocA family oxidoreductase [Metabacillus litoralis]
MRIKWGILSTAKIALDVVIPAINRSINGEVYAIASSSGKASKSAKEMKIPKFFENYQEMLEDPEIDAVYIPLPNSMHYEWTIKAAKAKKHILCEKPAALSASQVEDMISTCKKNNVLFMEAFMYRFHEQHRRVKELIEENVIGEIKIIRSSFSFNLLNKNDDIRLNPVLGGGSIYDVGCYCINSIRYILEKEPTHVTARGVLSSNGVDTSASVIMEFPNNVLATFDCSFEGTLRNEYEIVGAKGSIRVPRAFRPDINGHLGNVIVNNEYKTTEYLVSTDQYLAEVEHFSDCILNHTSPSYSEENTLANMRVIDAVYQSLRNKELITL